MGAAVTKQDSCLLSTGRRGEDTARMDAAGRAGQAARKHSMGADGGAMTVAGGCRAGEPARGGECGLVS